MAPKVSVIVPTLNAAGLLRACLGSVRSQHYPQERIQILVADGGSTDATRQIAQELRATVIENPRRIAEEGKREALARADGEFVIFLDADNEISSSDFVRLAVDGLNRWPEALGVESYYPAAPKMSSFCAYLTATLHISDPLSWIVSTTPISLGVEGEIERWTFRKGSFAYPLGANGFVFRRSDLDRVGAASGFEDTQVALKLALAGKTSWLRVRGRGVHHFIAENIFEFLKKRRRQTYHFLSLRGKTEKSWVSMNPRIPPQIGLIYCGSVIGPLFDMCRGLVRTGDLRWFWHPLASFASFLGVLWGVSTYYLARRSDKTEASLQPVQRRSG